MSAEWPLEGTPWCCALAYFLYLGRRACGTGRGLLGARAGRIAAQSLCTHAHHCARGMPGGTPAVLCTRRPTCPLILASAHSALHLIWSAWGSPPEVALVAANRCRSTRPLCHPCRHERGCTNSPAGAAHVDTSRRNGGNSVSSGVPLARLKPINAMCTSSRRRSRQVVPCRCASARFGGSHAHCFLQHALSDVTSTLLLCAPPPRHHCNEHTSRTRAVESDESLCLTRPERLSPHPPWRKAWPTPVVTRTRLPR